MKRGATTKDERKLINVWVPVPLLNILDDCIKAEDTDRAKFIRGAVREKIRRLNPTKEGAVK